MIPRRIMVTGAGGPGAVNLSRSLLGATPQPFVLAVDASPTYLFLALGHERAVVPRCGDRDVYVEAINALIDAHGIDFVMPNNSLEIGVLSAERDRLHAPVFLPTPPTLAIADSKWASYEIWRDAGLPVPEAHLLTCPDDVAAAFASLQREPDGPVWVRGAGIPGKGIGVASLPCRTVDQAIEWIAYWRGWSGMIASEFLPGDNLTWMGLYKGGRLVASQSRQRIAYVIPHVSPSGITGAPAISHTIRDPALGELAEAAVAAIDPAFDGVGFVDLKSDEAGRPRLTELNAGRFGTTHYFYTAAGANFPERLLRAFLATDLAPPERDVLPPDIFWIRTLDAGPVLTTRAAIEAGHYPGLTAGPGATWPLVPQKSGELPARHPVLWDVES